LATYQNGVTKENELLTFRHNVMEIPIQENITVCRLPLNQVQVAQWWLEKFKLRSTELGPVDWKKTSSLSFVAKIRLDNTKPQLLKIYKVVFIKNLTFFYFSSLILLLLSYTGIGIYFKIAKRKNNNIPKELDFVPPKINHNLGEEEKTILNYLGENYANPDLTLGKMSDILRCPEKTISGIVRNHTSMSFKEYLNNIRLTEAKRLLLLGDKNVSEIAYDVGFSSPNHFNRTFRIQEGCTPTEFKERKF
ncbi:MAG: helix-turn-helix transcriptional regulator, partial [Opitutaceae bacterium]|nr:helix-turn-helix transcriptional regulator [Cytophagales bacterium]